MKKLFLVALIVVLITLLCANVSAQGEGFTVTSVSTSDIITNETNLVEAWWIINTQFTGGGQAITGTITQNTIKNLHKDKLQPKKVLNIIAQAVNETATYEIVNEGTPIYKYDLITYEGLVDCPLGICYVAADAQPCPEGTNWDIPLGKSFWGKIKYRYCITKRQVGTKGVYNNPAVNFNAKISISNGDTTIEKNICSGAISGCDGSSISFDGIGVATWSGSLVTGDPTPNQDNFVPILRNSDNKWQIARKSTYENYLTKPDVADSQLSSFQNLFPDYEDVATGDSEINNAINPVNQASDILLAENSSFTSTPYSTDEHNTGKIVVPLTRKLTSPNIVFRIRADWIGIVIPTGEPQILNVTTNPIVSGETGTITVQVQNIGEVQGTFTAALVNCEPFIQLDTSQSLMKTLQPSAIENITINVSGGNLSQDIAQSCQVRVYEINNPSLESYYNVNLQLEKAKICVPRTAYAAGNLIKKCSSDGKSIEVVEKCENGATSDGAGGFICAITLEQREEYGCNTDSDCSSTSYCYPEIKICVQRSGCLSVMTNGDSSDKLDLVFVGDGYSSNDELKDIILQIVDYEGTINGLMSVEPFKSNKNKFNIWMIKTSSIEATGALDGPNREKALEIAAECTAGDYQVTLSKRQFRSYAYFATDAYLSLVSRANKYWGRLLLHEFGHSFGKLSDEYVEEGKGGSAEYDVDKYSINCASSPTAAKTKWGSVPGTGQFEGCEYTTRFFRPTFNSIMRSHYIFEDDYGPVNEAVLEALISKYR